MKCSMLIYEYLYIDQSFHSTPIVPMVGPLTNVLHFSFVRTDLRISIMPAITAKVTPKDKVVHRPDLHSSTVIWKQYTCIHIHSTR